MTSPDRTLPYADPAYPPMAPTIAALRDHIKYLSDERARVLKHDEDLKAQHTQHVARADELATQIDSLERGVAILEQAEDDDA